MSEDGDTVVCDDCDKPVELTVTPYADTTQYVVACDCASRSIDVTDVVSDSNLLAPITGKWTNFDDQ